MKWKLTADDAGAIAAKLGAERIGERTRHEIVKFRHNGRLIFTFGIRRSSKDKGHNFIPRQMQISQMECRTFRDCSLSLDAYIEILRAKGFITD